MRDGRGGASWRTGGREHREGWRGGASWRDGGKEGCGSIEGYGVGDRGMLDGWIRDETSWRDGPLRREHYGGI